jgi:hypothetical protein
MASNRTAAVFVTLGLTIFIVFLVAGNSCSSSSTSGLDKPNVVAASTIQAGFAAQGVQGSIKHVAVVGDTVLVYTFLSGDSRQYSPTLANYVMTTWPAVNTTIVYDGDGAAIDSYYR